MVPKPKTYTDRALAMLIFMVFIALIAGMSIPMVCAEGSTSSRMPYVIGTNLYVGGQKFFLNGVNSHRAVERKPQHFGNIWSESDVKKIKEIGANCIELQGELLGEWLSDRNTPNENYFRKYLDVQVSWCEKYQLYCIINMRQLQSAEWWMRTQQFFPDWLWKGIYNYGNTLERSEANRVIIDFVDTDVSKQKTNRQAFYNIWKFVANRYKNRQYVMFAMWNEPFVKVDLPDEATRKRMGIKYAELVENTIDAIRSTGSKQVIFVDYPRVGSNNIVKINRPNLVAESHPYIYSGKTISDFRSSVDSAISKYKNEYNQPVFFGEYGFFNPPKPYDWKTLLQLEIRYMDSKPCVGRSWWSWSYFYREADSSYNQEETERCWEILCE